MEKKNLSKQTLLFLVLVLFGLAVFGLDKLKWLDWLKRPMEIVANPIKRVAYQSFQSIIHYPSSITHQTDPVILEEKIRLLEQQLALLKVENQELKKENEEMRHLLGATLPASWQFLPAKVLGLNQGILVIDQGSDQGVKEGMIVISVMEQGKTSFNGGILIGRVVRVNPRSSQVMLISHSQSQVKAKILSTGVKGTVVGSLEGKIILEQVLQKENLVKDQLVVTTGEAEQFPANLLIGEVKALEKIETEIYQKGILESLVDFQKLETVFVKL